MKRPEKIKNLIPLQAGDYPRVDKYIEGYNKSCDDWEKWLPKEMEIKGILRCERLDEGKIIHQNYAPENDPFICYRAELITKGRLCELLAQAISKRIKGEQ